MSGLFAVHKPSGVSSAGLLNDLQNILKVSPLFEREIKAQQARVNAGRKGKKQKMGNKIKMGHGGTLDPLASGVLVVGTGRGTKDLGRFLGCSKDYSAIALFGCSTDTYDSEGKVVHRKPWKHITREKVEEVLSQFRGDIMQTPPIYSALKMQGKPLYEYAREGKPLPAEIKARPATVSKFAITAFGTDHEFTFPTAEASTEIVLSAEALEQLRPVCGLQKTDSKDKTEDPVRHVEQEGEGLPETDVSSEPSAKKLRLTDSDKFDHANTASSRSAENQLPEADKPLAIHIDMTVSSGTYVRSLIHDLGLALGSAAHMVALVRRRVGEFELDDAVPWQAFENDTWQEALEKFLDFGADSEIQVPSPEIDLGNELVQHVTLDPEQQYLMDFLQPCLPFTRTLTYAQSIDAKLSGPNSKPLTISCPQSFRVTHELRRRHDLIMIGVGTAISDDPGLNARDSNGQPYSLSQQPIPVILDPHGRLSLKNESKLMKNVRRAAGQMPLQLVHESRRDLVLSAATVIYLGSPIVGGSHRVRFAWSDIFSALAPHGKSVMIEGGASVIKEVLEHDVADQIIVTVAPTFVGEGTSLALEKPVQLAGVRNGIFGRDLVMAARCRRDTT